MFSTGLAGAGEEAVVPYVGVLVALVGRGGQDLAVAVCHFSIALGDLVMYSATLRPADERYK